MTQVTQDSPEVQTEEARIAEARKKFDELPPAVKNELQAEGDKWEEMMKDGLDDGLSAESIDKSVQNAETEANQALSGLGETVDPDEAAAIVTREKLAGKDDATIANTLAGQKQAEILRSGAPTEQIEKIIDANGIDAAAAAYNIAKDGLTIPEAEFIGNKVLTGDLNGQPDKSENEVEAAREDIDKALEVSDESLEKQAEVAEITGDEAKVIDLEKIRQRKEKEAQKNADERIIDDELLKQARELAA
ncbi:MAG: hypothetical protein LBK50_01905 [Candidatus Nomurabacteria bacterium]|jgi:hypothetical protein|nr:hypothetical protein [Candidatus Nomurabacteria bacterium]